MATLLRDVERPAFLDRPSEADQLSFAGGVVSIPVRKEPRAPLSERLRSERSGGLRASSATAVAERADTTRGGVATLDELLVGAWEGLSAHRLVTCPVCAGSMAARPGGAGGACGDCGSQLR